MLRKLGIVALLACAALSSADRFTKGNILISQGNNGATQNKIREYTRTGTLVQTLTVPVLATHDISDYNRGMVIDQNGKLHVYNGTFHNVGLSTYDPATSSWSTLSIPGLSVVNNGSYGKIATVGDYVFLPDHQTGGAEEMGIVRVDTTTNTWVRFAIPSNYNDGNIDLDIGPDGLLYCLQGQGSPSGRWIDIYDPNTLAYIRRIDLAHIAWSADGGSVRDINVRPDGNIWLSQLYPPGFLIDTNGNLLSTHTFTNSSYCDDFDMGHDGALMHANFDGRVYLYDPAFNLIRFFESSNYYYSQSFGMFVPDLSVDFAVSSFTLLRGTSTGGLVDLAESDDSRLDVKAGFVLFQGESPVQIEITGISPIQDPLELTLTLETSVNTTGLIQTVELYNNLSKSWIEVDTSVPGVSDSIVEIVITTTPALYIRSATKEIRARIKYRNTGFTLLWPWTAKLDQVKWSITP